MGAEAEGGGVARRGGGRGSRVSRGGTGAGGGPGRWEREGRGSRQKGTANAPGRVGLGFRAEVHTGGALLPRPPAGPGENVSTPQVVSSLRAPPEGGRA